MTQTIPVTPEVTVHESLITVENGTTTIAKQPNPNSYEYETDIQNTPTVLNTTKIE